MNRIALGGRVSILAPSQSENWTRATSFTEPFHAPARYRLPRRRKLFPIEACAGMKGGIAKIGRTLSM
jgi:hypothetical protein